MRPYELPCAPLSTELTASAHRVCAQDGWWPWLTTSARSTPWCCHRCWQQRALPSSRPVRGGANRRLPGWVGVLVRDWPQARRVECRQHPHVRTHVSPTWVCGVGRYRASTLAAPVAVCATGAHGTVVFTAACGNQLRTVAVALPGSQPREALGKRGDSSAVGAGVPSADGASTCVVHRDRSLTVLGAGSGWAMVTAVDVVPALG